MDKGEIAHLKFQLRAAELGFVVSKPTTECRYDFILEERGKLLRVQVKWCDAETTNAEGSVLVDLRSQGHAKRLPHYSKKEVDLVMVYIPKVDGIVRLVPKLFDKKSSITVRFQPPKSRRKTGMHLFEELKW